MSRRYTWGAKLFIVFLVVGLVGSLYALVQAL